MLMVWREREKIPGWQRNEVVRCLTSGGFYNSPTSEILYVEKQSGSSRTEVCLLNNGFMVQAYTVEQDTVRNYYWESSNRLESGNGSSAQQKYGELLEYWYFRWLDEPLMPVDDEQEKKIPLSDYTGFHSHTAKADSTVTTVIFAACYWNFLQPLGLPTATPLKLLGWSGVTNEEPGTVTDFCAAVTLDVRKPEYARNNPFSWKSDMPLYGKRIYPSYLRAIPLHTKEELDRTSENPLVDLADTRYHVYHAITAPYMLIPVPEKASPFPSLGKPYEPGRDKVRVKDDVWIKDGTQLTTMCFLIETFKGETWKD